MLLEQNIHTPFRHFIDEHLMEISWIGKRVFFSYTENHTNLNCKSWYIRATLAQVPYSKNYAPLSVYSTISNVLPIGGYL